MAKYTKNYNFKKPEQEEFYNVDDQNSNWDSVDATLKDIMTKMADIKSKVDNSIKIVRNISILSTGWTQATSGEWKYDINSSSITESSVVDVNVQRNYLGKAIQLQSATASSNGKVTIYAYNKPKDTLVADLVIYKEAL